MIGTAAAGLSVRSAADGKGVTGAGQDRVPRRVAPPMARFASMASAEWRAFKGRIPINSTHKPKNLKIDRCLIKPCRQKR